MVSLVPRPTLHFLTQVLLRGAIMDRTEFQPPSWGRGWMRGAFLMLRSFRIEHAYVRRSPRLCRGLLSGLCAAELNNPRRSRGLKVRGRETRAQQFMPE